MDPANDTDREDLDRLLLLLLAEPKAGWEREFEELIRREVDRLCVPDTGPERDLG
jgi:hypothetical protein